MGLSIKNAETERLVRELAQRRGVGVTSAIRLAVRNELANTPPPQRAPDDVKAAVQDIQKRWRAFPPINMAEMDAILYDENGLPR